MSQDRLLRLIGAIWLALTVGLGTLLWFTTADARGQQVVLSVGEQQVLKSLFGTSGKLERLILKEVASEPLAEAGFVRIFADSATHSLQCSFNGGAYATCSGSGSGVTSLEGLTGVLNFVDDTNITITGGGSDLTIGWAGTLAGARGGTGVANTGKTITIGGNFETSGAFTTTLTVTGNTNVTLPTSGTLVNTAVTSLPSLATVGTIGTGVWQGTAVATGFGGTGLTAAADDNVMVGNGTVWQTKALTSCSGATDAVTYDTGTNAFGCNTISAGAPAAATYLLLNAVGVGALTQYRTLAAGNGITLTDAGATSTYTVAIDVTDSFSWTGVHTFANSSGISLLPHGVGAGNTTEVRFVELAAGGTNYVGFKAPDAITADIIWTLPNVDSSGTQCLASNGAGVLAWEACAGGGGAPTSAQYVVLALDAGLSAERVLTGTANQITVTDGGANGNVTLSTPQNIHTGATPTFASMTLTAGTSLALGTASSATGAIVFRNATNANTMTIQTGVATGNFTLTFPVDDGAANQCLVTDGAGVLTWGTCTATAAPVDATFVTLTLNGTLTNERTLAVTAPITLTDGGANANVTVALDLSANIAWTGTHTYAKQESITLLPFGVASGQTSEVRFRELAANGVNYVGFKSPDSIATNVIWRLPNADGAASQCLSTNGAGVLSWTGCASGITGSGANTQVTVWTGASTQSGFSAFTYNNATTTLTVGGNTIIKGPVPHIDVKYHGVVCDGVSDDTAAFNTAIAAVPSTGAILQVPAGVCIITGALTTLTRDGTVFAGSGVGNTYIQINHATATALATNANRVVFRDFSLIGGAPARTTGFGIHLATPGEFSVVERVQVFDQGYGIYNTQAAAEIRNVLVQGSVQDGIFLDGNVRAQDEVRIINVQSNFNGNDGLHIVGGVPAGPLGAGAGIRISFFTASGNTGIGIHSVAGSTGWVVGSVWVTDPELSGNNRGLVLDAGTNNVFWTITGGLIETSTNDNVILRGQYHTISGVTITDASDPTNGYGIQVQSTDTTITGNVIRDNVAAGIVYGTSAANVTIGNNRITTNGIGIRFDGGTLATITGGDFTGNTALFSGTAPTGSVLTGFAFLSPAASGAVNRAALQAMQNAVPAAGGAISIPGGTFDFDGTTVTLNKPIKLTCAGRAATVLRTTSQTANVLTINGNGASGTVIEDCGFASTVVRTAGAYIAVTSAGTSVFRLSFSRLQMNDPFIGIDFSEAGYWNVSDVHIYEFRSIGIKIRNTLLVDEGDSVIAGSLIQTSVAATTGIRYESSGGLKLANTKILTGVGAGGMAFGLDLTATGNTGVMTITGCSIENQTTNAIRMTTSGGAFANVSIAGNEFATGTANVSLISLASSSVTNVVITGNSFANYGSVANWRGISISAGSGHTISGNTFDGGSGSAGSIGINVTGGTFIYVGANNIINAVTPVSGTASAPTLVGFGKLAFALLPTVDNGSTLFCTDCTTGVPCAGGGDGRFAYRRSGTWICN